LFYIRIGTNILPVVRDWLSPIKASMSFYTKVFEQVYQLLHKSTDCYFWLYDKETILYFYTIK
jgi:hypothetical protein